MGEERLYLNQPFPVEFYRPDREARGVGRGTLARVHGSDLMAG